LIGLVIIVKEKNLISDKFDITFKDLTREKYLYYVNNREMEHQIGRLFNMNKIFEQIKKDNIPGDIIEFGVYQGFSLSWLARFRDLHKLNNRKIIGIDSFEGLPITSGPWVKHTFGDSTEVIVNKTLQQQLTNIQQRNIIIIKAWFDDLALEKKLQTETNSLALIHIDCDLKVSLQSIFNLIELYLKGIQFLLFDDWGICDEEIPLGFNEWESSHSFIKSEIIYKTFLTRYYKIYSYT